MNTFKDELNQNTKAPEQVMNEAWLREKENIYKTIEFDYKIIKQNLLDKAKSGQYIIVNNKKNIVFNYECSYLQKCINKDFHYSQRARIFSRGCEINELIIYQIGKRKQYDLYIDEIKALAIKDDINICPLFTEVDGRNREISITLPYTYKSVFTNTHKVKAYLKCSIEY